MFGNKTGLSGTTRFPGNVERVRKALLKSAKRSAHKYALPLTMSDRTVRAREAFSDNLPHIALVFLTRFSNLRMIFYGDISKSLVYTNYRKTLSVLKSKIRAVIANADIDMLDKVD